MKIIDDNLMKGLAEEAKKSPRLRKNYNFHQSLQDKCHRFLNALEPGTFIPVHHHPDKDETFVILKGKVRVTTYNDEGEIAESCVISQESGRYGVDIPKNVWHGLECLEPSVLLECKAGPFVEHEVDGILETKPTKDIYFAGGCFWGTEHFFKQIEGVAITEVGFARSTSGRLLPARTCSLARARTGRKNVGECYYHGKGVEQDAIKAFEWYMKAADKGDMQSQVNVANAYYLGDGVEQDHTKAFLWYREAAFQGHVLSQKNVGAAFWNGDGVEKNLEECAFWYELAANGGDAQAQFAIGWFHMTGNGVPVDEKKGLKWIHKATFQGYQPAIDYCKEHNIKWY